MTSPTPFTNRLAQETSPYLQQHKHNPVDWYPWGDEAFEKARTENRPLLISIGYSACHWCHVMEHESFSDPEIARYINETVIPVKVDREERPDVDAIYMNACMAMSGHGGWPLNAFVTPDLKPFFVGTYFPPKDHYGRPGFLTVLQRIREAWLTDGHNLRLQADTLFQQLEHYARQSAPEKLADKLLEDIIHDSRSSFDARHGGFGTAPKFPPDTRLAALLAASVMHDSQPARAMITDTLDAMTHGGIHDQLGGGFFRYSVDAQWQIPHFEKMLYNQALMIPVLVDAWKLFGTDDYLQAARHCADWVLRDLTSPEGTFQCAYDADSEGEEGKFYVWTPAQVKAALPSPLAEIACAYYGISDAGNFEHGTTNPHIIVSLDTLAAENSLTPESLHQSISQARSQLLSIRQQRPWPFLDEKCLTAWNGLMISALCSLGQATGNAVYLEAATRCCENILANQWKATHLNRVYKDGASSIRGTLDDYAYFCNALIDLYESTFLEGHLTAARKISETMIELFHDQATGSFHFSDGTDSSLISRTRDSHDGATPSSTSLAILAILRIGHYFTEPSLIGIGQRALEADGSRVNRHPSAFASLALANLYAEPAFPQIVITAPTWEDALPMLTAVHKSYLPAKSLLLKTESLECSLPLAADKPIAPTAIAYICQNQTCSAPITNVENLTAQLKK